MRGLDVLEQGDHAALVRLERMAAELGEQSPLVHRSRVSAVEPSLEVGERVRGAVDEGRLPGARTGS